MSPKDHALKAYEAYRSKLGLSWHDDQADSKKFIESVEYVIGVALREAGTSDTQKELMKDTTNGQHAGKVELSVGQQEDEVAIDFGTTVRHISLPPDQAFMLAKMITKTAKKLKRKG